MFKDKYKQDMEDITPSSESLMKAKEKMMEACVKKPRRIYAKPLVAAAFCLVLITGGAIIGVLQRNVIYEYENMESPYITRPNLETSTLSNNANLKYEGSYEDIYGKIKAIGKNNYYPGLGIEEDVTDEAGSGNAPPSLNNPGSTTSKNYSDTNNQVEGVQEADIIKTDGKYIYACGNAVKNTSYYYNYSYFLYNDNDFNNGKVYILSADNGKLNLMSTIAFRNKYSNTYYVLREILVYGNNLVLIKEGFEYADSVSSDTGNSYKYAYYNINRVTSVEIYDITDRANPVFKNELYQSGAYSSSRMIGVNLYIISNYAVFNPDGSKPETYIPYCSAYDEKYLLPVNCIFVPETISTSQYNVITSIDVTKPENHKANVATLGFSGTIYASDKNIYIAAYKNIYLNAVIRGNSATSGEANNKWTETTTDSTDIYRFSISDGEINLAASGCIKGKLINQFAMDEYKDSFRVAVTVNEYITSYVKRGGEVYPSFGSQNRYNELYILDMNLNVTGSVDNMAPGETIYSVRFDGEVGYVVTYRQVDPLFAIDLSDVTAPKVLSALKIPGFSSYMHPYGDGLLFGLGRDAGGTNGLKMSMFDVTDKTNVTEKSIYKLNANSYYSEALNNHKAILVDPEKNIIGFPVNDYNEHYYTYSSYKIYTYENNVFKEIASFPLSTEADYNGLRGLYIGDYIYVFAQNRFINSYEISSLTKVDSYNFN